MAVVQMTDRWLSALAGTGKAETYADAKVAGLVLRVNADATVLAWSLLYRNQAGKRQRVALGRYPATSLADARGDAIDNQRAASKGQDPAHERRTRKTQSVVTLADAVEEYLRRGTAGLRSAKEVERRFRVYILPKLGPTPLAEWHRRDVALLLDRLKVPSSKNRVKPKGSIGRPLRGGPAIANRCYDDLRAFAGWCVVSGYLEHDPMSHLARPAALVRRDRVLDADELRKVLLALPSTAMSTELRRIVRLILLTACRVSEIAELRVEEVDFERGQIRLPAERVKNGKPFVIPLPPEAVAILRDAVNDAQADEARRAKRLGRDPASVTYVFPGGRGQGSQPVDGHAVSVAIRRALPLFGVDPFTPHDIRRSVATGLGELGVQPHIVEVVLNHVSGFRGGVAGTYNRSPYLAEHAAALARWAVRLAEIEAGTSTVVPFGARA